MGKRIHFLEKWQGRSPDLYIIGILWSVLQKNICKRHPETLVELWNNIPVDYIVCASHQQAKKLDLDNAE